MTINGESSVYVGGLPYDATESSIRHVFSVYGAVVAIKSEWDEGQDRERDHDLDRERYRDRFSDRSRERDWSRGHDSGRERGYERHEHDRAGEYSMDRDHNRDVEDHMHGESRNYNQDWDRDHELNLDEDSEPAGTNGYHRSVDEDKEQRVKRRNGSTSNDHGRELSTDDYNQMKKELEKSIQSREELKTEICCIFEILY
ncbi:hypothetical protein F3Y22_tig00111640pilonHSYRG00107 [Hibiscus syriacus]|uniref:RRM domain-containing protein n=1 Tax=Hibiscus syriacus TaxID=106335 RepID=A0A6A2XI96_HIBSY|nr:hypothetical protein F3Y22_tig00111640pilonHSYRG00107 [Hibiscus syriacus]